MNRTNETDLADDELIIFDVLFDGNVPINSLKSGEDFSLGFNCDSHRLNSIELKQFIEKSVSNGNLQYSLGLIPHNSTGNIITYVGLTEKGGGLWEKERKPIWENYIFDSSSDENGCWELSIFSPSLEIAKQFLNIAQESNLYLLVNPNNIEISEATDEEVGYIIPWKFFKPMYKIKSKLEVNQEDIKETDWKHFNKNLTFWRTIGDLQELLIKTNI